MTVWDYDCAVIGGGPGGLVAMLYLLRFRRKAVLINDGLPRAAWIPKIHNLIGYERGVSGVDLLKKLHRQLSEMRPEKIHGEARVRRFRKGFEISVGHRKLKARKVILATGIEDMQPDLRNLDALRADGLLRYCPICDAYEYRGRDIVVLAAGDHGLQAAVFLGRFARNLKVIVPTDLQLSPQRVREFRALKARIYAGKVKAIEPLSSLRGVRVILEGHPPIDARVAYPMLGQKVRDSAFAGLKGLKRTKEGYLSVSAEQRTSIPGLFAVGDCVNLLCQVSVAAGQAAVAATAVHNELLGDL